MSFSFNPEHRSLITFRFVDDEGRFVQEYLPEPLNLTNLAPRNFEIMNQSFESVSIDCNMNSFTFGDISVFIQLVFSLVVLLNERLNL